MEASSQATPELIDALGALTTLVHAQGAMLMTVFGTQNDVIRCASKSVQECYQRMDSIIPKLDELLRRNSVHQATEEPEVAEEPEVVAEDGNLDEEHDFEDEEEDTFEEPPAQPTWEQESDEEQEDFDFDAFWGPRLDAWAPAATVLVEEESATSVIVEEPLELPVEEQEATVEQIVEQQAEEDSFDYPASDESTAREQEPEVEQTVVEEKRTIDDEEQEHAEHAEKEQEHFDQDDSVEPSDETVSEEEEEKIDYDLVWGSGGQDAFAPAAAEPEIAQGVECSSTSDPVKELVDEETKELAEEAKDALQEKNAQQQQKKRPRKDRHRQQKPATDMSTEPTGRESIPPAVPVKDDEKRPHVQAAPTKPPHHQQQKGHHHNGGAAHHGNGGPPRGGFRGPRGGSGGPRGGGYGGPRAFSKTPRGSGASLASGKQLFDGRRVDANNNALPGFANDGFASAKFAGKQPQNAAPRRRPPVSAAAAAAESSIRAEWGQQQ